MTPVLDPSPLADPRVETIVAWAQSGSGQIGTRAGAALEALDQSLPRWETAPAIALAAAAAYARVAGVGPRDLQTGHRLVALLVRLGESGAQELVRLGERTHYQHARAAIAKALARAQRELGVPAGELEDAFGGPVVDDDLRLTVPVGPFHAVVGIGEDLRRVRTTWRSATGRLLRARPPRAVDHPDALAIVHAERRRLQAHLANLRMRLEYAMATGRSWSVEQWATRMFADPLRAALARRLVWRLESDAGIVLALPESGGLRDAAGRPVKAPANANVEIWHPARDPERQAAWIDRASTLGLVQPIDQIARQVTLAHGDSLVLPLADGVAVAQRPFRGFLLGRGWRVPYLGPWFTVPEATREMPAGAPIAVVHLEPHHDSSDAIVVHTLTFRSRQGRGLDARALPPEVVSEAARDLLGALAAARQPPALSEAGA